MSSEEESFVILGSTPTPSMENYTSLEVAKPKDFDVTAKTNELAKPKDSDVAAEMEVSTIISNDNFSIVSESAAMGNSPSLENDSAVEALKSGTISQEEIRLRDQPLTVAADGPTKAEEAPKSDSSFMSTSVHENFAASFLLGDITSSDVLKANVFSQFPSLCSSETSATDIIKLQNFMCEYVELKDSLKNTNQAMRKYFLTIQKWQNETKTYKDEQSKQMKECTEMIAKLKNENEELRKDLNSRIEQIQVTENLMKKENQDLAQAVSEKSSLVSNLSTQIEKLERQHMSFEYIKREKEAGDGENSTEREYITMAEHNALMREMRHQLSEVTAKNLEFEDMRKQYIDEITCLKVNLVSAEELLKQAQADIKILQSKDTEKSGLFESYEKDRQAMKNEIDLLRTQLEIYRKDFEMERNGRQELNNEKDQLMTDLKMLQKRNQQLIEEAQERLNQSTRIANSSSRMMSLRGTPSPPRVFPQEEQVYRRSTYICPICNKTFTNVYLLEQHVHGCLDKA